MLPSMFWAILDTGMHRMRSQHPFTPHPSPTSITQF